MSFASDILVLLLFNVATRRQPTKHLILSSKEVFLSRTETHYRDPDVASRAKAGFWLFHTSLASCPYTVSNLANCTWQAYFLSTNKACNCREQVVSVFVQDSVTQSACPPPQRAFGIFQIFQGLGLEVRKNENVVSQPKVKALHNSKRHRKSQSSNLMFKNIC